MEEKVEIGIIQQNKKKIERKKKTVSKVTNYCGYYYISRHSIIIPTYNTHTIFYM